MRGRPLRRGSQGRRRGINMSEISNIPGLASRERSHTRLAELWGGERVDGDMSEISDISGPHLDQGGTLDRRAVSRVSRAELRSPGLQGGTAGSAGSASPDDAVGRGATARAAGIRKSGGADPRARPAAEPAGGCHILTAGLPAPRKFDCPSATRAEARGRRSAGRWAGARGDAGSCGRCGRRCAGDGRAGPMRGAGYASPIAADNECGRADRRVMRAAPPGG
jgi:hypothetical protein